MLHQQALVAERAKHRDPPPEWEARLREISPVLPTTSHLRFRWLASAEQWALYQCIPKHLLHPERVAQFARHWSELPKDQQMGRRMSVSEYQFRMFHDFGVDAHKTWILQGTAAEWSGGTPARYTDEERMILHAENESTETIPAGTLPAIPFDERVVRAIRQRDRLLQVGLDVDRLRQLDSVEGHAATMAKAQKAHRAAFLKWMKVDQAPVADFLAWFLRKKEADRLFRNATQEEAYCATTFTQQFTETGVMPTPHLVR